MKRLSFLPILAFFALASRVEAQMPAEFINLYAELEGYSPLQSALIRVNQRFDSLRLTFASICL